MAVVHRRLMRLFPLIALLLLAACAGARPPAPIPGGAAPEVSRTLGPFVSIEEGTDIILTVGARVAAMREADAFFPLEVSVTNKRPGQTWTVSRESFLLFDEEGRSYPLPTNDELTSGYHHRTFDSRIFDARTYTTTKLDEYRPVESSFFPDPIRGIGRSSRPMGIDGIPQVSTSLVPLETVSLPPFHYLDDVLYFPHPPGPLVGRRFSLEFKATGLAEPARISFRIPKL